MTPEQRADACLEVPKLHTGRYDWSRADNMAVPVDLKERIIAALHAAAKEERERMMAAIIGQPDYRAIAAGRVALEPMDVEADA